MAPGTPPRRALITGAGSGMGQAIALRLAEGGVRLCLAGRRTESLEATARLAGPLNPPAVVCGTDLSREDDVRRLARIVQQELGILDILVHCAGTIEFGHMESAPATGFDALYRTNVRGPYQLTQLLLPLLREGRGQIVFINSTAGLEARASTGQYAATKHALRAVADALRQEVNRDGIRVTSVFVGRTATPMQALVHKAEGREYHPERLLQPDDVAQAVVSVLSLPWSAEVTDLRIRPMAPPFDKPGTR